jgi:hypothetical protein
MRVWSAAYQSMISQKQTNTGLFIPCEFARVVYWFRVSSCDWPGNSGQSHVGEGWQRTGKASHTSVIWLLPMIMILGYCGLGQAVKSLGLATTSEVELDFVVASLGSVNNDLISAIYNAAQGQPRCPSEHPNPQIVYLLETRGQRTERVREKNHQRWQEEGRSKHQIKLWP